VREKLEGILPAAGLQRSPCMLAAESVDFTRHVRITGLLEQPHHLVLLGPGIKPQTSAGIQHFLARWEPRDRPGGRVDDVVRRCHRVVQEGEAAALRGHTVHEVASQVVNASVNISSASAPGPCGEQEYTAVASHAAAGARTSSLGRVGAAWASA